MNQFRELYDSLPDDEKDRIMAHLHDALKWRGWARSSNREDAEMLLAEIDTIASVFEILIACIVSIRTRDETTLPVARALFAEARLVRRACGRIQPSVRHQRLHRPCFVAGGAARCLWLSPGCTRLSTARRREQHGQGTR
jgi:hypothetical protein